MDEDAKTIELGPRSRKASSENKNPNSNKIQDAAQTAQQDTKLITQSRRRNKSKILVIRDDDDIDLR